MQDTLSSIISTIKQLQHKLQKKISQLSIFYNKIIPPTKFYHKIISRETN